LGFTVIIPARYGSTRLPGKPLLEIAGKPMIQHVHQRAVDSGAERVVVATDDGRVLEVARGFGAEACLTSADHASGTDRLAETAALLGLAEASIIVNLQGDEPQMPSALIRQAARLLEEDGEAAMATLCARIDDASVLFDPHTVKVVMDARGYAIYFSRAPIPWARDAFAEERPAHSVGLPAGIGFFRHIGLYAYRAGALRRFADLGPSPLERAECLEQLRALEQGWRIRVAEALSLPGQGVDTAADLARLRESMAV